MLIIAEYLKNPHQPELKNPAVWIEGDRIAFVGPASALPDGAKADSDIYQIDGAIFPGLVNAHCHLELAHLENLPYPGEFVAWIRRVLVEKYRDRGETPERAMARGILQSLLGGTTCVGDHISCNGDLEALLHSPLRGRIFIEVLGVVEEVAEDLRENSLALSQAFAPVGRRFTLHPSPHSIHALHPVVLKKVLSHDHDLFSIHLGESETEQKYFSEGSGSMADLIRERGSPIAPSAPSALRVLEQEGFLDGRILAVHGNYFSEEELKLCAGRGVSIVHCPLSHQYFGHRPFPMDQARRAGVNLALGADSLASARSLSMLEVLRGTGENFPDLSLEEIFAMATAGGAKALKLAAQAGEIAVGKKADIIGIRLGRNKSPLKALFEAETVEFSMIDGRILIG
jgi:cytosine/adenosine deaminase-related metal-dependent hydrolase